MKDLEYMKHSLKNYGEKNMDNTVWQLLCLVMCEVIV